MFPRIRPFTPITAALHCAWKPTQSAGTTSKRNIGVLSCEKIRYGVSCREDLDSVKKAIANMKMQGIWKENLQN